MQSDTVDSPPDAAAAEDERDMAGARGGDRAAFDRLIRRHAAGLYSFLARLGGNEALARAAFDETVAACARALPETLPDEPAVPWLYREAAAHCLEHHPGPVRRWLMWRPSARPRRSAAPGAPLPVAEAQAHIERALAELPVEERAVFLLSRYGGLARRDVARVLGLSLRGTRVRLNRAVHRLAAAAGGG